MKNTILFLSLVIILFSACKTTKNTTSSVHIDDSGNLVGVVHKTDFLKPPFVEWFEKEYNSYTADIQKVKEMRELSKDVDIKVVMGTWCPDSRREVPRFYKILDMLRFDSAHLKVAAVDRSKSIPEAMGKRLKITRVPTVIFYRNGKEINRIVEYPIETLEADMLKILSGEPYKNAYAD